VRAEEVNLFYPLRNHSLAKQQLLLLCLFALFVVVHPKVYCNSSSIDTMANNNGRQGGGGGGNNQMNEHVEFTVKVSEESYKTESSVRGAAFGPRLIANNSEYSISTKVLILNVCYVDFRQKRTCT
jgi:hypothetical protein